MKIKKNVLFDNSITILVFLTLTLYALNLRLVFDMERFNPIEKSMWLFLSLIVLFKNDYSRFTLYYIFSFIFLSSILLVGVSHELFSFSVFFLSLTQVPIVLLLCASFYSPKVLNNILILFSVMPIAVVAFGFLYETLGISTLFLYEYATDMDRLRGSSTTAYLASWCVAAIYSSMKLVQFKNNMRYYVFTLLNFIILYLTVARLPLFVSLMLSAYVFYFGSPYIRNKVKSVISVFGIAFMVFFLIFLSDKYTSRIESSGDSGRELIWDFLLQDYENNLKPWGAGFGHQYVILPDDIVELTNTVAAHNEYIRLLVELGGFGSFIFWLGFYSFFIMLYLKSRSEYKGEMLLSIVLFSFYSYYDNTIATPAIFSYLYLVFATNNSVSRRDFEGEYMNYILGFILGYNTLNKLLEPLNKIYWRRRLKKNWV